jgi:hypothetical protein
MVHGLLKNRLVLILATAGLLVIFLMSGATHALSVTANTVDQHETQGAWEGWVHLDGESYVTAGDPGHLSQKITAQGNLKKVGLFASVDAYVYKVFVNGIEQPQYESSQYAAGNLVIFGSDPVPLTSKTFQLPTGSAGTLVGAVRVELWASIGRAIGPNSWVRLGSDEASLVNGAGSVHLSGGQSDAFQEGETIKFDLRTGAGHWTLTMFDGTGNPICGLRGGGFLPLNLGDHSRDASDRVSPNDPAPAPCANEVSFDGEKSTTAKFVVPAGAFRTDGRNLWRVVLKNTLIDQSADQVVVIDKKDFQPEPPVVVPSAAVPEVGTTETLTLKARANPASNAPITNFIVSIWYGTNDLIPAPGDPNWINNGGSIPATRGSDGYYTGQATFRIDHADRVHYRAYSVDSAGRMSGSSLTASDVAAIAAKGMDNPNGDARGHVDPPGSDHATGLQEPVKSTDSGVLLLVILAAIVLGILSYKYIPLAPMMRVAIIVAGVGILGTFAAYQTGALG